MAGSSHGAVNIHVPSGSVFQDSLAETVDWLAHTVRDRWRYEEELRQVHDPFPLPVRWQLAAEGLTDHWSNIRRDPPGHTSGPLDLAGQLDEVVDVYRRVPSERVVVLGGAGSGKTILAIRFVLDFLRGRASTDPVPVIFSLGSWNAATISLRDWLIGQLERDYPDYAARGPGKESLASALVRSGHILPVLDGFDEMADGLRRPALEALNAAALPLLLTSRPAEYAAAVAETDVLTGAAVIELTDLTVTDLADYLPRTARKVTAPGTDGTATVWDPVLDALDNAPADSATAPLATVLRTPLMVALARTVYSDTPDRDPRDLLDTRRFSDPATIEDHLLDGFVRAVYRDKPAEERERARDWLGYLAQHLHRLGTPDLAWWQLDITLRRSFRMFLVGLVGGLFFGLVDGLMTLLAVILGLKLGAVVAIGNVLGGGLAGGLACGLVAGREAGSPEPSRLNMPSFRKAKRRSRRSVAKLKSVLLGGLAGGLALGLVFALVHRNWVWGEFAASLGGTLLSLLIFGLATAFEVPVDIETVVNPPGLLKMSRRVVVFQVLMFALLGGLVGGIVLVLGSGLSGGLAFALGIGGSFLGGLNSSAWGRWVVLSRFWLPLTGRLPWAVIAFLEDAHRRGVLRQAGPVYQFRQSWLQYHLARAHESAS
ncbi:NACHT domain-containing protein [Streptomyces mirabilis]|uniref:NACHT domain-containing protein n=1 Tax=Streptomyces mirabilis TaxID=68239 RepID=UPI0037A6D76D